MDNIKTRVKVLPLFAKTLAAYISRLFLLDLWLDSAARPVLAYGLFIHITGMILFNWLEGWGYLNSLYFTFITLATIGYGDFVPTSTLSKIVTIFFSINGIVFLLVLFDLIRTIRAREFKKMSAKAGRDSSKAIDRDAQDATQAADELYSEDLSSGMAPHSTGDLQAPEPVSIFSRIQAWLFPATFLWKDEDARNVVAYAIFIIAAGTFLFHLIEGWEWLNSTYFVIVTLTTIGFGDFVPVTSLGKIITIFYGINGIVIFLGMFDSIRRVRIHQIRKVMRIPAS